ncbi:MAG: hypothetical protein P8P52_03105 [Opitutae bacterium]|nr:hypothetical protein [Opitutae bacterium]
MSIRKQNTSLRQSVDIRRLHLRVPAHATDPVIQIVNRNQQHIRPALSSTLRRAQLGLEESLPKRWIRLLRAGVDARTSQKCAGPNDYSS